MLRTKLAKKVLTKAEQKHLTENNIRTMAGMIRQIDFMKDREEKHPGDRYSSMIQQCYECYVIGKKLGLIGEENV